MLRRRSGHEFGSMLCFFILWNYPDWSPWSHFCDYRRFGVCVSDECFHSNHAYTCCGRLRACISSVHKPFTCIFSLGVWGRRSFPNSIARVLQTHILNALELFFSILFRVFFSFMACLRAVQVHQRTRLFRQMLHHYRNLLCDPTSYLRTNLCTKYRYLLLSLV